MGDATARATRRGASAARSSAGRLGRLVQPSVRTSRLVLAAKTAIAAGIAWTVGHLLPDVDQYSYYAPLGALIAMMPTLMGSLRSAGQTILGLGIGVLLAWAVILSPLPGFLSVALAVGLGVVLAGIRGLGAGGDYVPIAALFMLVIGGANPDEFSAGYLLQMGLGMLVGVIVNVAVLPPLWLRESSEAIGSLRRRLAEILSEVARGVEEGADDLGTSLEHVDALERAVRETGSLVADAAESRRLNVRARRHPYDMDEDFHDLAALDRLMAHVRALIEDVRGSIDGADDRQTPHGAVTPIAEAVHRLAALVLAWDAHEAGTDAVTAADAAITRLRDARTVAASGEATTPLTGVELDARRVVAIVDGRLEGRARARQEDERRTRTDSLGTATDHTSTLGP